MNKDDIKQELTQLIADIENPELIDKIKKILTAEDGHFWESLSKEQKEELRKRQLGQGDQG